MVDGSRISGLCVGCVCANPWPWWKPSTGSQSLARPTMAAVV